LDLADPTESRDLCIQTHDLPMDKKKIEDLSNLVFGLALALGAISLTRPDRDEFSSLFQIIVQFGLSFAIIIWIWWIYNNLVAEQDMDRRGMILLNVLLLFLVVIEPFLLSISLPYSSGKVAYSLDLGIVLLILALFAQFAISEARLAPTEHHRKRLRLSRNTSILCAAIFFTSLLPQFMLAENGSTVQSTMWLSALFIGVIGRNILGWKKVD